MSEDRLHVHSILVHAVVALAPFAAASFICQALEVRLPGIDPSTWLFLLRASLVTILVVAVPSTITGITERNHMYANWHTTHRLKLGLSVALLVLVVVELAAVAGSAAPLRVMSWVGLLIVVANNLVVGGLAIYGLKITLGHVGFSKASYVADMHREEPVDVVESTAARMREPAKIIDVLEEAEG